CPALCPAALAEEGMWLPNAIPAVELKSKYGFEASPAALEHLQKSAVRFSTGGSGSIVSPNGLVMTNHHVGSDMLAKLSTPERDLLKTGFLAKDRGEELRCPDLELNALWSIEDVTDRVVAAGKGAADTAAAGESRRREITRIEDESEKATGLKSQVVTLWQGGRYHLYRYRTWRDVRLVFAPEFDIGFFGGDPDNFNFPRYNLDMALLRVYADNKPAQVEHHFRLDPKGADEGELVMVTGHPGSTQRLLTAAQLEAVRDIDMPFRLALAHELRGYLTRYSEEDPEQARIARTELFYIENGIKARNGMFQTLLAPGLLAAKREEEQAARAWIAEDPARVADYGDPWQAIERAQTTWRNLYLRHQMIEALRGFASTQARIARTLVRGTAERAKPDPERLREYSEAALPSLEAQLFSPAPIYASYEQVMLAFSLTKLREVLGADHAVVQQVLGKDSPAIVAARVVGGTRLADVAYRRELWSGGVDAVNASNDPMIALIRQIEPAAYALRQQYDADVDAVVTREQEKLARMRFARFGTSVYPDATFTLRLSHGEIKGWQEQGEPVAPYTTFAGLFMRASDHAPFTPPPRWVSGKGDLDLNTRFNQVSTNDIIGGNSGSPLLDRDANVVGLVFDGNIHSLGGAYLFDETVNRTVSVHAAAIDHALRQLYDLEHLADEMTR
ncbi:MAG TPA: S46 family peptidase, partial [Gammaproteobacteria bacterium]|nr:S46 family peptidase [Gammaproteobacteria bacterium]